jgi:hypothetical protein
VRRRLWHTHGTRRATADDKDADGSACCPRAGIDSPYEAPLKPEITLKTHEFTIEKSVDILIDTLRKKGYLSGAPEAATGLAAPDGGELVNCIVPTDQIPTKLAEAATLPSVPLTDLDVNWLQVRRGPAASRHHRLPPTKPPPNSLPTRQPNSLPTYQPTNLPTYPSTTAHRLLARSLPRDGPRRSRASCVRAPSSRPSTSTR